MSYEAFADVLSKSTTHPFPYPMSPIVAYPLPLLHPSESKGWERTGRGRQRRYVGLDVSRIQISIPTHPRTQYDTPSLQQNVNTKKTVRARNSDHKNSDGTFDKNINFVDTDTKPPTIYTRHKTLLLAVNLVRNRNTKHQC